MASYKIRPFGLLAAPITVSAQGLIKYLASWAISLSFLILYGTMLIFKTSALIVTIVAVAAFLTVASLLRSAIGDRCSADDGNS